MESQIANEKQLAAEIELLREQFANTQELYREVCGLLFFRHGIAPTANKLYQLVRKGSMSAPAEALAKFWHELREKSRVRIEHPDLPEGLKQAAGKFCGQLWRMAQQEAEQALHSFRQEAKLSVQQADAALGAAEAESAAAQQALQVAQDALQQANQRINTQDQQIAAAHANLQAVQASLQAQISQLAQAQEEKNQLQQTMAQLRLEHKQELAELLATNQTNMQMAESRARDNEKRVLLELDRERSSSAKWLKELEASRQQTEIAKQNAERERLESANWQLQLGDLRQKIGMLEGSLQASSESKHNLAMQISALQKQAADAQAEQGVLRIELDSWRRQAEQYQKIANDLQQLASSKARRGKKLE